MSHEKKLISIDYEKINCISKDEMSYEELMKFHFSPGDVFWKRKFAGPIRLIRAGDIVNQKHMHKFREGNHTFFVCSIVNQDNVNKVAKLFEELSKIRIGKDRSQKRNEILGWFKKIYWDGEEEGSLLDLVMIGERAFYIFEKEVQERLQETSMLLYRRSSFLSILSVFFALGLGHMEFTFLSDLYHICYLFDYSLEKNNLSFAINEALEMERMEVGRGKKYLAGISEDEVEKFESHPRMSMNQTLTDCKKYFVNPDLVYLIDLHHERVSGNGFPNGINENEMSDIENIITSLVHIIAYDDIVFENNDGPNYAKKILARAKDMTDDNLGIRMSYLLNGLFENIKVEDNLQNNEINEEIS